MLTSEHCKTALAGIIFLFESLLITSVSNDSDCKLLFFNLSLFLVQTHY